MGKLATWGDTRDTLCSNTNLARICIDAGISAHIVTFFASQDRSSVEPASTTVEAVIGAAYLDGGLDAARRVLRTLNLISHERDPMNAEFDNMATKIQGTERILKYSFVDPKLLSEALQPFDGTSSSDKARELHDGKIRLAILGNPALNVTLADAWFQRLESRGMS